MRNALFFLLFLAIHAQAESPLYHGEQMVQGAGFPALIHFEKGKGGGPLVIFVPGFAHLARISYGYPGGNEKDFLNYWLLKKGFSFLGISYPLNNPVFGKIFPDYSIRDWGAQMAEIAKKWIVENHLSNHVIVLGWSMGGKIAQSIQEAAEKEGLELDFFVSLSGVPPFPYIFFEPGVNIKPLPNGLTESKMFLEVFSNMLKAQDELNHHVILPKAIYEKDFLGNTPINLLGSIYRYQKDHLFESIEDCIQDTGCFSFHQYPFIGVLNGDSQMDPEHCLFDSQNWSICMAQKMTKNYLSIPAVGKLSPDQWKSVKSLIANSIPEKFCMTIHGNHFFFVGEAGARQTAEAIETLADRYKNFKKQLSLIKIEPISLK